MQLSDLEGRSPVIQGASSWLGSARRQCLTNASLSHTHTHIHTLIPLSLCVCTSLSWTPVPALILWTRCWCCSLVIHQIPFCHPQTIPLTPMSSAAWQCTRKQTRAAQTGGRNAPRLRANKSNLYKEPQRSRVKSRALPVLPWIYFLSSRAVKRQRFQVPSSFCVMSCFYVSILQTVTEKRPHLIADFIKRFVFFRSAKNAKVLPDLPLESPHRNNV